METFLGNVAKHLYNEWDDNLSSVKLLMPNQRSRIFFLDELGHLIKRPIWQPHYVSIDDIMRDLSGYTPIERIRAIVELYKIYSKYHLESFDSFYFWGEALLNDFDQIDKYMVDADMLFTNLSDIKAMEDDMSYFNEEQKKVVQRFWSTFGAEENFSEEKRNFLTIWRSLRTIYHEFRQRLAEMGMAYTGMMHREAAERLKRGEVSVNDGMPVAVVGFNALSECEKILFDHMKTECNAQFFWDYDDYYLSDYQQEAGLFIRDNISRYGQAVGFHNHTDNFTKPKNISTISVPSGALQCKYATTFLHDVIAQQGKAGKETAIILTDESLLMPLLYSIPSDVGEINVTMGYPLRETLAYSFTERLLKLQMHIRLKGDEPAFYHADVTGLLRHPFVQELDATNAERLIHDIIIRSKIYTRQSELKCGTVIDKLFVQLTDRKQLTEWIIDVLSSITVGASSSKDDNSHTDNIRLRREYAGIIADTLRRLSNSLDDCGIETDIPIFASLTRRMLQTIRVPYNGEPLQGIQVMGILETRNLDFKNILIMSMNDDNFPGNPSASTSFIPYNLRLGYGLPTPQHHDGVYAYYFYRLLQRADKIDMTYSSKTDENSSGEPSRYIYQLEYEAPHNIEHREIGLNIGIIPSPPITVQKDSEVMEQLNRFLDKGEKTISPTAMNSYLDCPLKFYMRYVAQIKPDDEVSEGVDMPMFGTILHKAMELLYTPFKGIHSPGDKIKQLIGSQTVAEMVDKAIDEIYFHNEVSHSDYEGSLLMVRDIVIRYINRNILPFDARLRDFTIAALEYRLTAKFEFIGGNSRHSVTFSGLADRVDRLPNGAIRIVDYKTGTPHMEFANVEALFGEKANERNPAVLQTLLYSLIVDRMQQSGDIEGNDVCPSLYYVRLMYSPDYSPLVNIKGGESVISYKPYKEEFEGKLSELLGKLFDPSVPFSQCDDTKPCTYCDFASICKRT